jgi:serine/threonine-protein kinase
MTTVLLWLYVASQPRALTPREVGRYLVYDAIASGGMATVHYGAILGESGFSRIVAIKRVREDRRARGLHRSLIDEARLVSRISHPNVVATLDVVAEPSGKLVVLEYVAGESLSTLLRLCRRAGRVVPPRIAMAIIAGVLHGLHAAHEACSVSGEPLGIVHRDVSPQNILVGSDGVARVLDFGIAKANERLARTHAGQVKGKPAYLAPEQVHGESDRRTDVFAAGVVLWEMLTGRRLFYSKDPHELLEKVLTMAVPPPSTIEAAVSSDLDAVVMAALDRDPARRYASAAGFALALEERFGVATASQVARWVRDLAGGVVDERSRYVAEIERDAAQRSGRLAPSVAPRPALAAHVESSARDARPARGADEHTEVDDTVSTMLFARGRSSDDSTRALERPRPSLASETPSPPEPREVASAPHRRWGLLFAAIATTGAAIVVLVWPRGSTGALGGGEEPGAPWFGKAAALAPPPPPTTSAAPAPPSEPTRPRLVPAPPPAKTASAPPPPATPSSDPCKPPWRLKNGIRIPKPECI